MQKQIILPDYVSTLLPKRPDDGHKGTFGHLLLIAGHAGMMGAAVLAARAALRSGVGKVTVHVPRCGRDVMQIAVPEAVLQVDDHEQCWSTIIDPSPYSAIAVGPGLGTEGETTFALRVLLKDLLERETSGCPIPAIIDADALNIAASDFQMMSLLPSHCILTPHIGEMRRLCAALELRAEDKDSLESSAHTLAKSLGLTVILKSHIPHIYCANGSILVIGGHGNSALAKAGSGDVLTGLIGGLTAQGLYIEHAATAATYLHQTAGRIARCNCTAFSTVAGDLISYLGDAFQSLFTTPS